MTPLLLDILFYILLLYTTITGFKKGLIKGVADIFALVLAIFAAKAYGTAIAVYLDFIREESWRIVASYIIVFIAVIILIHFLCVILEKLVKFVFLGWLNRILGAMLGFIKGLIIVCLIVLALDIIMPNSPYVRNLPGFPLYSLVLEQFQKWLPNSVTRHINFNLHG